MRIVILGSTGQVGSCITERIRRDYPDAEILACARKHKEGYTIFDPFKDDWGIFGKVDVLINSVGIIEEKDGMTFEKAHQGLTRLMLKNAELIGTPRFIQISVLGADVNSKVPFMFTKALADEELLKGSNAVVVRPSIVCTHNTVIVQKFKMIKGISRWFMDSLVFPAAMLETKMQPVLGDDVADVVSKLCSNKYTGIINVAGPEEMTIRNLITYLPGKIWIIKVSNTIANPIMKVVMKVMPKLINAAQYELLFKDNVTDKSVAEKMLGRPMQSTVPFWRSELGQE
jgi:uncharacterized protein YbjT (DUF2867 family)